MHIFQADGERGFRGVVSGRTLPLTGGRFMASGRHSALRLTLRRQQKGAPSTVGLGGPVGPDRSIDSRAPVVPPLRAAQ